MGLCWAASVAVGAPNESLRAHLWARLPEKLRALQIRRSTKAEVLKSLGTPGREKGDVLLYRLRAFDYDTQLDFDRKNVLRSVEVRFRPQELTLEALRAEGFPLEDGTVDPALRDKKPHEWGREGEIELKKEKLVLRHGLDEARSLRSLVFK